MGERMTRAEIDARFDAEWVLIDDPEPGVNLQDLGGMVVYHGKDKDEVWRKVREFDVKRFAVLYAGKFPDDVEWIFCSSC